MRLRILRANTQNKADVMTMTPTQLDDLMAARQVASDAMNLRPNFAATVAVGPIFAREVVRVEGLEVLPLLALALGSLEPHGTAMSHDMRDLATHIELADAVAARRASLVDGVAGIGRLGCAAGRQTQHKDQGNSGHVDSKMH